MHRLCEWMGVRHILLVSSHFKLQSFANMIEGVTDFATK